MSRDMVVSVDHKTQKGELETSPIHGWIEEARFTSQLYNLATSSNWKG